MYIKQQLTVRLHTTILTTVRVSFSPEIQKFHNVGKTENFNKTDTKSNGEVNINLIL